MASMKCTWNGGIELISAIDRGRERMGMCRYAVGREFVTAIGLLWSFKRGMQEQKSDVWGLVILQQLK